MDKQPEALRLDQLDAMHERGTINRGHIYEMLAELRRLHAVNKQLLAVLQEPVATYTCGACGVSMRMESATAQQEPLTDEQISDIAINNPPIVHVFARAIEAAHGIKEKNT